MSTVTVVVTEQTEGVSVRVNDCGNVDVVREILKGTFTHDTSIYHDLLVNSLYQKVIPVSTSWNFEVLINGITQNALKQFNYKITGVLRRDNIGIATVIGLKREVRSESVSDFSAQIVTTSNALIVQVKDESGSGDIVQWVAELKILTNSWT